MEFIPNCVAVIQTIFKTGYLCAFKHTSSLLFAEVIPSEYWNIVVFNWKTLIFFVKTFWKGLSAIFKICSRIFEVESFELRSSVHAGTMKARLINVSLQGKL